MANRTITDLPNIPSVSSSDQLATRRGTLDYKMSVSQLTTHILGNITPSNTIVVREEADFPTAVGGIITLAPGTVYKMEGQVTVNNRFFCSNGSSIISDESFANSLTYTGTGTMFTGTGLFVVIRSGLECPNGTLFDFSGPTSVLAFLDINITSVDTLGTIDGIFRFIITTSNISNIVTDGITLIGNITEIFFSLTSMLDVQNGSLINFGSSTVDWFSYTSSNASIGVTANLFSSDTTGDDVISSDGLAIIDGSRITGAGTYLDNISKDDSLWIFTNNKGLEDTMADSVGHISATAATTISSTDPGDGSNAVLLAGTWSQDQVSQMTVSAAGRFQYFGQRLLNFPIDFNCSIDVASGTNRNIALYIRKGNGAGAGSLVTESKQIITVDSGRPQNVIVTWQEDFIENDWVEAWVANETNTVNITANTAVGRVN